MIFTDLIHNLPIGERITFFIGEVQIDGNVLHKEGNIFALDRVMIHLTDENGHKFYGKRVLIMDVSKLEIDSLVVDKRVFSKLMKPSKNPMGRMPPVR